MALIAIAAASLATPAFADTARAQPVREIVSYSDLNLANPEQAQTMVRRIARAAERVCKSPGPSLTSMRRERACERQAVQAAVRQLPRSFALAETGVSAQ
jgi:UrcA family protein